MVARLVITAFFACALIQTADAAPDHGSLEASIREELDHLFDEGDYVMDIEVSSVVKPPEPEPAVPLPGLAFTLPQPPDPADPMWIGDLYKNKKVDVLIVVDAAVAQDRVRVADEVTRRLLTNATTPGNFTLALKREAIAKPEPPKASPAPEPEPPQTFLDQVEDKKDLLIRFALFGWVAIVSLMGVFGIIHRFSGPSHKVPPPQPERAPAPAGRDEGGKDLLGAGKKAATKEELYSKDQAHLKQVEDLVSEARENAVKVAKVLSRWVSSSEEAARQAAMFLRNCDIKTMEALAERLHPADIEAIMQINVEDFDMFGEENTRVLEQLRGELALLSAERLLKDRPDPLDFAKTLSDEDIVTLVEGESLDIVALVATQIPPHRMQKFYATLSADRLQDLLTRVSTVKAPTFEDFEKVRDSLARKASALGSTLFDQRGRIQTVGQLFNVIQAPGKLEQVARGLAQSNPDVFKSVRGKTLLPRDVLNFSQRAVVVLAQGLDPDTLAVGLGGLGIDTAKFAGSLSEAFRAVFQERSADNDDAAQEVAWRKVVTTVRELVASGLLAERELSAARVLSDQALTSDQTTSVDSESEAPHAKAA